MSLHVQRVFGRGDWNPSLRLRLLGRLIRFPWPWNECDWAGLWRRCPYYDCQIHGRANRAPLVEERARRDAYYRDVLRRTEGVDAAVLTPELLDRTFAQVYFDPMYGVRRGPMAVSPSEYEWWRRQGLV